MGVASRGGLEWLSKVSYVYMTQCAKGLTVAAFALQSLGLPHPPTPVFTSQLSFLGALEQSVAKLVVFWVLVFVMSS